MVEQRYDVVGVGNAIVDVLARVDDGFIATHQLNKGSMTLIDAARAVSLYDAMPPGIEASGGSAANTMAGLASLGSQAAYVGKVRDDQLGDLFRHDLRAQGVRYEVPLAPAGPPTARCLILVTPDAERTMNTFLGISSLLEPGDVDTEVVTASGVVYCEGYLWDVDSAKAAIRLAMETAKSAGRKVALSLSDGFCVDRHRHEFLDLAENYVDLLFANEPEICSLYEVEEPEAAIRRVAGHCEIAAITRGAKGSVIVAADGRRVEVPSWSTGVIVDTTGAGDLYASGFLHGYTSGLDLDRCGWLGSLAAGECISHMGPRPLEPLSRLVASH
jgi:sugar/nucleoside kinase (ribokinase family)